jgi:hypothetical protein
MRFSFFWYVTQRRLVVRHTYRRFGTKYRSHFQGSSSPGRIQVFLDVMLCRWMVFPDVSTYCRPSYSRPSSRRRLPVPEAEGITILRNIRKYTASPLWESEVFAKYASLVYSKFLVHLLRPIWTETPVWSRQLLAGGPLFFLPFTALHIPQLPDAYQRLCLCRGRSGPGLLYVCFWRLQ